MIRKLIGNKGNLAIIPFLFDGTNQYDVVKNNRDKNNIHIDENTGLQRLKNLFSKHEDNYFHPDLIVVVQNAIASFIGGGIYGGITRSRYTFVEFIEKNEATQFLSHLDAKRRLSDKMYLSFMRGFAKWGIRVCIFCTTFTLVQTMITVYHDKYSFWHYSAAGMSAGVLYKFPLGPRGMVSGGIFGAFFGTVFGTFKLLLLKMSNLTEEQLLTHRKDMKIMRDEFKSRTQKEYEMKEIEKEIDKTLER